jgi:dTDP-L-rhamnose 4-epimerase
MSRILVTGGAGFIGSHLSRALLDEGHEVRVLDRLERPSHADDLPRRLDPRAEFLHGDVADPRALDAALDGIDLIFHLAASGGYTRHVAAYLESNSLATARLLERIRDRRLPVARIVVASSMAVYGEGAARCPRHGRVHPGPRQLERLESGRFEPLCPVCAGEVAAEATDEGVAVAPERPYSISKFDQERLVLCLAPEIGVDAAALRYFVTYGPGQSLTNPYTGVISIFASRVAQGLPPVVYEDGRQSRDFIHVDDLVAAHLVLLREPRLGGRVFNVGTGRATRLIDLAHAVCRALQGSVEPSVPGRFRLGDVRHIHADPRALESLGWKARIDLEEGLRRFAGWFTGERRSPDRFADAEEGLRGSGLVRGVKGDPSA